MFSSNNTPRPIYTFIFDGEGEVLSAPSHNGQHIARYTIKSSKKSKHNLTISYVPQNNTWDSKPFIVGTSTIHPWSLSGSIDTSIRNHNIKLRKDPMSGSEVYKFHHPFLGSFEWKPDVWTGNSLKLFDNAGRLLARYKRDSSWNGNSRGIIEFFVIGQAEFVDLVVVTAIAILKSQEKEAEQAEKVMDVMDVINGLA